MKRLLILIMFAIPLLSLAAQEGGADGSPAGYSNEATGYRAAIVDAADLLSETEERQLLEVMVPVTEWGNALFCSTSSAEGLSAPELAARLYERAFGGGTSGTVFLIDMDNRQLQIYSDGAVYRTVSGDYAQSITDNVYRLAGAGDYAACAQETFREIAALLAGERIRQPMKHISNYLLALTLALLLCYFYMASGSTAADGTQPAAEPVFKGTLTGLSVIPGRLSKRVIETARTGSSGGFSGGSGFSGGGGGGHSGGGGGHGF